MTSPRNERGQVLVLTVLSLTVLLGLTALVLDVGDWFRTKRQLQATADAAALAGAQALPDDPANANQLALTYADKNGGGVAGADVTITNTNAAYDTILVKAKKRDSGFFSNLFGVDTVNVGASAKALVGVTDQALYVAPMVVSDQHPLIKWDGTSFACGGTPCFHRETTLPFDPMGAPGAFGMLNLDGESGTVGTSHEAAWILHGFDKYLPLGDYKSDPGAKFSSNEVQSALDSRMFDNPVLLFPVFHVLSGTGQNAVYEIIGWIGFHLDSYEVHGNNATLTGYFTKFIAEGILAGSGTGGPPDFGVKSIQLIG